MNFQAKAISLTVDLIVVRTLVLSSDEIVVRTLVLSSRNYDNTHQGFSPDYKQMI
jgi:hypothetical protein